MKSYHRIEAKAEKSHNQHKSKFPDIARKLISEADIILEILDARFWQETRNPEFEKEIKKQGKKIIFVLNKSDLVDKKKIVQEMENNAIYPYVLFSCKKRRGSLDLMQRIKREAKKIEKDRIYVGLIGYPNTGKSSIINLLKGSSVARVSSVAGYTKGVQKVKIAERIFLVDTPGVIPSNEDSTRKEKDLFKHAEINVRRWDKVKEPEAIVHNLFQKFPEIFEDFYNIKADKDTESLIEQLGRKKGFILKGNEVDEDRTSRLILRDFQEGKIRNK